MIHFKIERYSKNEIYFHLEQNRCRLRFKVSMRVIPWTTSSIPWLYFCDWILNSLSSTSSLRLCAETENAAIIQFSSFIRNKSSKRDIFGCAPVNLDTTSIVGYTNFISNSGSNLLYFEISGSDRSYGLVHNTSIQNNQVSKVIYADILCVATVIDCYFDNFDTSGSVVTGEMKTEFTNHFTFITPNNCRAPEFTSKLIREKRHEFKFHR